MPTRVGEEGEPAQDDPGAEQAGGHGEDQELDKPALDEGQLERLEQGAGLNQNEIHFYFLDPRRTLRRCKEPEMRALVQRVSQAAVDVEGERVAQIGPGMLVLLGVRRGDDGASRPTGSPTRCGRCGSSTTPRDG